jgi:hypothetical protein
MRQRYSGPPTSTDVHPIAQPEATSPELIMRITTALVSREVSQPKPMRVDIGDRVVVGERDTDWPAFVFVTSDTGSGRVPLRYLSRARPVAVVNTPYDTSELPTREGDVIEVVREDRASGWLWCRSLEGRQGWVPATTLVD